MEKIEYIVPERLEPYINCIMAQRSTDPEGHANMPFYADGYPGIMFQKAEKGFYQLPRGFQLSQLFLYGQTLKPISLDVKGPYEMVVFQLYPFASKYLLGVDPKILNDDCYDLARVQRIDGTYYLAQLLKHHEVETQIQVITQLMLDLIDHHQLEEDDRIQQAIALIIGRMGQVTVQEVTDHVHTTERTLERQFLAQVGLSPKQFARIIQFQTSLKRLDQETFDKLTEVGVDSGFADQSHFIRTFKKYTGQTPSFYLQHSA